MMKNLSKNERTIKRSNTVLELSGSDDDFEERNTPRRSYQRKKNSRASVARKIHSTVKKSSPAKRAPRKKSKKINSSEEEYTGF